MCSFEGTYLFGPVAQLVRAPPCHGGGRGFESHSGRLQETLSENESQTKFELSEMVVRRNLMRASRKAKIEFSESNFLMNNNEKLNGDGKTLILYEVLKVYIFNLI